MKDVANLLQRAAQIIAADDEATAIDLAPREWTDATWDELTPPQQEAVWEMLEATYREIGLPVANLEQLKQPKYRLLTLWDSDNDNLPNAFMFYRVKPAGNKMFCSGSDGSKEAKRASISKTISLLKTDGWYAELSERPAELVEQNGLKRIQDEDVVRETLDGENITWLGDGYYTREISGVGRKRKALYGRPKTLKNGTHISRPGLSAPL